MTCELDDLSDADLLTRAREGDTDAYGVIFKRHWQAGRAMAMSITGRFEPDDLASEAFARILKAVEKGKGPTSGFRSYLATTVRNVAIDWSRRTTTPNIDDPDALEDWSYSELTTLDKIERETMAKAFYALPDSWQEVLWYTEVEDMAPREVAPLLGLTANAVSALASRAREGLRQAWIGAHLAKSGAGDPVHAWTVNRLGGYVRGKLSRPDRRRIAQHLEECPACSEAAGEADRIGSRLALAILPLILGTAGAAGYTAWAANSTTSAAAASVPASGIGAASPASRVRHLLQTAGSSSHAGLAAVATTVAAAAALTVGSVMASPPSESVDAKTSDASSTPSESKARAEDPAPHEGSTESGVQAEPPSIGDGGSAASDAWDDGIEPRLPSAGTAPAGNDSDVAVPGLGVPPAGQPAPAKPTPPDEPDPDEPDPAEPATPEAVAGRESAVRTIPPEDTLFAYRLDDTADTAVDFIHNGTARYDRSAGGSAWALRDQTLRRPTDVFSVQIWFRTSVGGGRLIGYSDATQGTSRNYDRHLFLTDDGRIVFGVYPGTVHTIASERSYADDQWHLATATLSPDGMSLYVDADRVAHDGTVVTAQVFDGYWRIGFDNLDNWGAATPSQRAFSGSLAYAAVYRTALTSDQIRTQWVLGE